jgi:hypothetical protein
LQNKIEDCFKMYSNLAVTRRVLTVKPKGKGKAIQLQVWTGPEGSRKLRLPEFKTIGT